MVCDSYGSWLVTWVLMNESRKRPLRHLYKLPASVRVLESKIGRETERVGGERERERERKRER